MLEKIKNIFNIIQLIRLNTESIAKVEAKMLKNEAELTQLKKQVAVDGKNIENDRINNAANFMKVSGQISQIREVLKNMGHFPE